MQYELPDVVSGCWNACKRFTMGDDAAMEEAMFEMEEESLLTSPQSTGGSANRRVLAPLVTEAATVMNPMVSPHINGVKLSKASPDVDRGNSGARKRRK